MLVVVRIYVGSFSSVFSLLPSEILSPSLSKSFCVVRCRSGCEVRCCRQWKAYWSENGVQLSRGSPLVSNKQSTIRESKTEYFKFDRTSETGDVMVHDAIMVAKRHSVRNNKNEIMSGNPIYER